MSSSSQPRAAKRSRSIVARVAVAALSLSALTLGHGMQAAHAASTEAELLAEAMTVSGTTVTGASFVAHPDFASTAVATTPLAGFPKNGGSFAILSSGNAEAAYPQPRT